MREKGEARGGRPDVSWPPDSFHEVVHEHGEAMFRFALSLLGDETDARDAVQEALASAWQSIHLFEGRSTLRTWLIGITSRRAIDTLRRRRPTPVDSSDLELLAAADGRNDPAADVLVVHLLAAANLVLDRLPPRQRTAWLLREAEGLSYREIAAAMHTSEAAVRGYLQRARAALASQMSAWR